MSQLDTSLSYHFTRGTPIALADQFGDGLEHLSASDKTHILLLFANWQHLDTIDRESGGEGWTLEQALNRHYSEPKSPNVITFLDHFADEDPDEGTSMRLIQLLALQLERGIYAR
ncbi:MAG: hypothetical protein KME13_23860 [Myxacorys californica WJT36-NPBG1]|jgi:hypothetical protein|nr:hypothetical protein [Myxacorys californica WJT36-NPBG1]